MFATPGGGGGGGGSSSGGGGGSSSGGGGSSGGGSSSGGCGVGGGGNGAGCGGTGSGITIEQLSEDDTADDEPHSKRVKRLGKRKKAENRHITVGIETKAELRLFAEAYRAAYEELGSFSAKSYHLDAARVASIYNEKVVLVLMSYTVTGRPSDPGELVRAGVKTSTVQKHLAELIKTARENMVLHDAAAAASNRSAASGSGEAANRLTLPPGFAASGSGGGASGGSGSSGGGSSGGGSCSGGSGGGGGGGGASSGNGGSGGGGIPGLPRPRATFVNLLAEVPYTIMTGTLPFDRIGRLNTRDARYWLILIKEYRSVEEKGLTGRVYMPTKLGERKAELERVFVALSGGRQEAAAGSSWRVGMVEGGLAAGVFTVGQPAGPPATAGGVPE
jgi:hypothetical protein